METFTQAVKAVKKKCAALFKSPFYKLETLPKDMPEAGVYVFSKGRTVLYVGRTNKLRRRLQFHTRNNHNQATFAFLLARKETGKTKPSYKTNGSRSDLLRHGNFRAAFNKARSAIREMDVQFIEERDPNRQALLEICTAMKSKAKYNDFDNR